MGLEHVGTILARQTLACPANILGWCVLEDLEGLEISRPLSTQRIINDAR